MQHGGEPGGVDPLPNPLADTNSHTWDTETMEGAEDLRRIPKDLLSIPRGWVPPQSDLRGTSKPELKVFDSSRLTFITLRL